MGMRDKYWTVLRRCLKSLTQVTEGVTRWGQASFFLPCLRSPLSGPLWLSSRCRVGVTAEQRRRDSSGALCDHRKGSRKATRNRRDATRICLSAQIESSELHLMRLRLTSVGKFEADFRLGEMPTGRFCKEPAVQWLRIGTAPDSKAS